MTENVVPLQAVTAEPDAELVAEIRRLLDRVERGEVTGVAYVATLNTDRVGYHVGGKNLPVAEMHFGLSLLQADLVRLPDRR